MKSFPVFVSCLVALMVSCNSHDNTEEPAPEKKSETHTLRVLTYNIFHGEATDGTIDMDLFAQIIKDQSPDLVALQEVDKYTTRVGGIDITAELSKHIGLDGYFGKFRAYKEGEYGAAILSKYPVVEFKTKDAYVSLEGVIRTYLFAKVKLSGNNFIYFNSSHLSTIYEERVVQTGELVDYYKNELDKSPLLICGDLNAVPDSDEMDVILEQFAVSDTSLRNTHNARSTLRRKIDYVLYPKNENWRVLETKQICRSDASDHCAVLSVLEFSN